MERTKSLVPLEVNPKHPGNISKVYSFIQRPKVHPIHCHHFPSPRLNIFRSSPRLQEPGCLTLYKADFRFCKHSEWLSMTGQSPGILTCVSCRVLAPSTSSFAFTFFLFISLQGFANPVVSLVLFNFLPVGSRPGSLIIGLLLQHQCSKLLRG